MKHVFCIAGLILTIAISPMRAQHILHVLLNSENSVLLQTEYSGTVTICADGLPIYTEGISGETGVFGEFRWIAPDTLSIPADQEIAYQVVVEADGEIVDSGKIPWVPVGNARNAEFAVDAGYAEGAFKADQARADRHDTALRVFGESAEPKKILGITNYEDGVPVRRILHLVCI